MDLSTQKNHEKLCKSLNNFSSVLWKGETVPGGCAEAGPEVLLYHLVRFIQERSSSDSLVGITLIPSPLLLLKKNGFSVYLMSNL